jgi:hypothetical protein
MIIFEQSLKIMRGLTWTAIVWMLLFLTSCGRDPLDVDISKSDYTLRSENFDKQIQDTKNANLPDIIGRLKDQYPELIDYQFYYCFKTGLPSDSVFGGHWDELTNNDYFNRLSKRLKEMYPRLRAHQASIESGFKRLKIHFPTGKFPTTLVFMNSFFASSIYCTENELAVGLERYLGPKTQEIKELPNEQFYDWIKIAMDEKYLDRDAVCGWIQTHMLPMKENMNHIEAMIYWGKVLYLTEAAYPEMDPAILMRYSQKNYDWANQNERNFWEYLVKQNLLFQKNATDQAGFVQEGPFTAGLPQKGPDRLGQFLGYRIVKSFIDQNDVTLQQLLDTPYTELLQQYEIND